MEEEGKLVASRLQKAKQENCPQGENAVSLVQEAGSESPGWDEMRVLADKAEGAGADRAPERQAAREE